jgi:hypothetical protein
MRSGDEENWDDLVNEESEETEEDGQGTLFWNSPSSAVPLDGTDKFLVVSGPDAGKVADESDAGNTEPGHAPVIHGRDEALDGSLPLFLAHRGVQGQKLLPNALARLHQTYGEQVALGSIVRIPSQTAKASKIFFEQSSTATVRIADPVCYLLDSDILRLPKDSKTKEVISKGARTRALYLETTGAENWVDQVLEAQREAGANLLLTPGRALDPENADQSIEKLFSEANQATSLLKRGERLALNVTMSWRWLVAENLMEKLFGELLEQDQFKIWYIRAQWPAERSYVQPSDIDLLKGYKRLAELALDEDHDLLLPQTGLTGWLMLAFGAKGFGIGSSGTSQAFTEPSYGRSKGAKRRERYFERQLIHSVERNVHELLASTSDYQKCTCPFCPALLQSSSSAWSHELAGMHGIYCAGAMAAEVEHGSKRGGYHGAIRRIVKAAVEFAADKELAEINAPRHLATWGQLL